MSARDSVAREMLMTERSYVNSLRLTIEFFVAPLRESIAKKKAILKQDQLDLIFSNVEVIVKVNEQLLQGLEERLSNWNDMQKVGDVFLQLGPFLKCYTQYCEQFEGSNEALHRNLENNSNFKKFVRKTGRKAELRGLDLESYLIMPVQRIPRYVLLLKDMLKHTPANHLDYKDLQQSIGLIEGVAKSVNEGVRNFQRAHKLMSLQQELEINIGLVQPNRNYVGEIMFPCLSAQAKNKNVTLYVMSDLLLFASEGQYLDRTVLHLVWIEDGDPAVECSFRLHCPAADNHDWVFVAGNAEEKAQGTGLIESTMTELLRVKPMLNVQRGKKKESVDKRNSVEASMTPSERAKQRRLEKKQTSKIKMTKDDSKFQTLRF